MPSTKEIAALFFRIGSLEIDHQQAVSVVAKLHRRMIDKMREGEQASGMGVDVITREHAAHHNASSERALVCFMKCQQEITR